MAVLFARGDAQGEAGGLDYEEIAIGGELAGMSISLAPFEGPKRCSRRRGRSGLHGERPVEFRSPMELEQLLPPTPPLELIQGALIPTHCRYRLLTRRSGEGDVVHRRAAPTKASGRNRLTPFHIRVGARVAGEQVTLRAPRLGDQVEICCAALTRVILSDIIKSRPP
ncbi:hypothetical protein SS05631_c28470 [Sinorhizobium sp. CCBAU 05631]|nr:hypothetical protein SS05631_c28470 [Sinorhizobium sp. CCBAU 05631]